MSWELELAVLVLVRGTAQAGGRDPGPCVALVRGELAMSWELELGISC